MQKSRSTHNFVLHCQHCTILSHSGDGAAAAHCTSNTGQSVLLCSAYMTLGNLLQHLYAALADCCSKLFGNTSTNFQLRPHLNNRLSMDMQGMLQQLAALHTCPKPTTTPTATSARLRLLCGGASLYTASPLPSSHQAHYNWPLPTHGFKSPPKAGITRAGHVGRQALLPL